MWVLWCQASCALPTEAPTKPHWSRTSRARAASRCVSLWTNVSASPETQQRTTTSNEVEVYDAMFRKFAFARTQTTATEVRRRWWTPGEKRPGVYSWLKVKLRAVISRRRRLEAAAPAPLLCLSPWLWLLWGPLHTSPKQHSILAPELPPCALSQKAL